MIPLIQKEPAVVAGAVLAVLNMLQALGMITLTADALSSINLALIAVLTLFVRQTSTSTASPTLKPGTEVQVKGTTDSVVIEATPPGPVGVEGGAGAVDESPTMNTRGDAP